MKSSDLPGFDEHPESIYKMIESMGISNAIPGKELIETILESKEFKNYISLNGKKGTEY
ncbi:hypothetical protein EHEL_041397 [Encephalitozoon hellem ATCC 50504]|nr:uncharacterized protein EHEL_041397 [Encephalitozoon hellem ATCC 50504]AHL28923.1 hypothetical protein EHEL_041397 [Encephalitozoon hellem ATCC 50504]UTX43035.1 hypothetical protein GPU96_04g07700 [Encephalitozoon hellem]